MNLIPLLARHHVLSALDLLIRVVASFPRQLLLPPVRNFYESTLSQISVILGISCKSLGE